MQRIRIAALAASLALVVCARVPARADNGLGRGLPSMTAAANALGAHRYPAACAAFHTFFSTYGSLENVPSVYVNALSKSGHFTGAQGAVATQHAAQRGYASQACAIAYVTVFEDLHEGNPGGAQRMLDAGERIERGLAGSHGAVANAAHPAVAAGGPIPTGQYHCFSGVGWDAFQAQPGVGGLVSPQFEGYLWIYGEHGYANMKADDRGTYSLEGNEIVAHSGPWVRVNADLHYARDGVYHQPTIFFSYKDAPSIHFACTPGH